MILVTKNTVERTDGSVAITLDKVQRAKGLGYILDVRNPSGTFEYKGFTGNLIFGGRELKLPNGYSRYASLSLNAVFLFTCKGKLYIGSHGAGWLYEVDPDKETIEEIITSPNEFFDNNEQFPKQIFDLYPETDAIIYHMSVLSTNYKYKVYGYNSDDSANLTTISISATEISVSRSSYVSPNAPGAVTLGSTRITSYYRTLEKEDFDPLLEYIQDLSDAVEDVQDSVAKLNSEARSKFVSR